MALPYRHLTADRLRIREGGGVMSVFGLPFLAAGVFAILGVIGVVPISDPGGIAHFAWPLLMLMGLVFTAVGGTLVFGRSWTTIDAAGRRVTKQLGLVVTLWERSFPFDDYRAVRLDFVRGDSDSADRFPVALKARAGADLKLCSFTTYADSRACAIAVAQLLRLDVEDASTDHLVRLPADQADVALQQRLRRERTREPAIDRPPGARSQVSRDADAVRIDIPSPAAHPVALVARLIPIVIPLLVAPMLTAFFRQTRTPDPFARVFLGTLVFFFGVLPVMSFVNGCLRWRRGRTIVHASRSGIRIQERGAWRTRTVASLDASDILDVDYSTRESTVVVARHTAEDEARISLSSSSAAIGPRTERVIAALTRFVKGRGLTVKTRQGFTSFGQGLDDDEIRYLHAVVRRALSE